MSTGKGIKRTKNQPVFYSSLKKLKGIWLTEELWEILQNEAVKKGLSCSEYIERKRERRSRAFEFARVSIPKPARWTGSPA